MSAIDPAQLRESILGGLPRPPDPDTLRKLQQDALRTAADGTNPVFRELAREVLAGRMTLREAATSSAYREAFSEAADGFTQALHGLSTDEIKQLAQGRASDEVVAKLGLDEEEQPAEEPTEPPVATGTTTEPVAEDDDFNAPIMTAPRHPERMAPSGQPPRRARWNRRWQ